MIDDKDLIVLCLTLKENRSLEKLIWWELNHESRVNGLGMKKDMRN
jgi:hypothetical protein